MGIKFDMGGATLATLAKQTGGANQDLGALVKQLIAAAQPLEGVFSGAGKQAWDRFKERGDQISADLNGALNAMSIGQGGMNAAFIESETEQADNARRTESTANFDSARFSTRV